MPEGAYLKSIIVDSQESPDRLLAVRGAPKKVTLVLGVTTSQISGIVSGDDGRLANGQVSLTQDSPSGRLMQQVKTASDGSYLFKAVEPGKYRLSVFGVDLESVEVGENDKVTQDLKLKK